MKNESPQITGKVLDFRIPLPWLLTCLGTLSFVLVSMWVSLNQLVRDVGELQGTVKAGNTQAAAVLTDILLLKMRVDMLETERFKGQPGESKGRK